MDRETQATYAVIAGDYAEKWRDRTLIADDMAALVARLAPGARVLDLGCGPGYDGQRLADVGFHVVGLDLSMAMLRAGRTRGVAIPVARGDMRRLPLPDGAFDAIWLNASLLHLPRAEAPTAVAECARVLRPGALLHIAVKAGEGEERTSISYGHPRRRFFTYWQAPALDDLLTKTNLEIINRRHTQGWLTRLARRP